MVDQIKRLPCGLRTDHSVSRQKVSAARDRLETTYPFVAMLFGARVTVVALQIEVAALRVDRDHTLVVQALFRGTRVLVKALLVVPTAPFEPPT